VALWHDGYRAYVVHTGSMMPTYNPGDVIIDKPAGGLHVGETITFRHSDLTTDVVSHRIRRITPHGIVTKGDANRTADAWRIRPDQVRGQVVHAIPRLGFVMIFLKQPAGVGSVMTAVLALILLWDLFFASATRPAIATRMVNEAVCRTVAMDRLRRARRNEPLAPDRVSALRIGSRAASA
jgi:signal peptidase